MYAKQEEGFPLEDLEEEEEMDRRQPKGGKLKKERFKPLQKVYNPVNSNQICGILSEQKDGPGKENRFGRQANDFEMQEINSWSREDNRIKLGSNGYMK
jgi:hypothetical protein